MWNSLKAVVSNAEDEGNYCILKTSADWNFVPFDYKLSNDEV